MFGKKKDGHSQHYTGYNLNISYATATKNGSSPSFLTTLALSTSSSPTANLNLSHVAGESKFHTPSPSLSPTLFPFILRASLTASLSAKNTVLPRNSGGSPIPLLLCTVLR